MLSIALPDPILREKILPRVAERRARFTRIVKGALGGCLLLCVAAIATTALADDATPAKSASSVTTQGVRAAFVPSIESIDNAKRPKAARQQHAFVAPHKKHR